MRGLEILENIDLDKILQELKARDKKIDTLSRETKAQKQEMTHVIQK